MTTYIGLCRAFPDLRFVSDSLLFSSASSCTGTNTEKDLWLLIDWPNILGSWGYLIIYFCCKCRLWDFSFAVWFAICKSHTDTHLYSPCWQSQDQVWWFTRRTNRTQHIFIHMALIYYSERVQSKIKGKKRMAWNPAETQWELPRALSKGERMYLISPASNCDNTYEELSTRAIH